VLDSLGGAVKLRVALLDACRDNPFTHTMARTAQRGFGSKGLARVDDAQMGANTMIAYAAAPGKTASDGKGENSPFTAALIKHLGTPGLAIQNAMIRVAREDYAIAKSFGTVVAWDAFLVRHPAGLLADIARGERDKPATPSTVAPLDSPRKICATRSMADGPIKYCVSSVHAPENGNAYGPSNLFGGPAAAWVPDSSGPAIGAWVSVEFDREDLIWPGRGGVVMTSYIKALASAVKEAGVTRDGKPMKIKPHILRKTFITWQTMNGLDASFIQAMVGHAPGTSSRGIAANRYRPPEQSRPTAPRGPRMPKTSPFPGRSTPRRWQHLATDMKKGSGEFP
jgi:hypothetical protein